MELQEIKDALLVMKPHYDMGFTSPERKYLEKVNRRLFGHGITNTGCSNCYRDAFVLINLKLKKMTTLPAETQYVLKRGKVLYDKDTNKYYSRRIENVIAEKFLLKTPSLIDRFEIYPKDWKERLVKAENPVETPAPAENPTEQTTENPSETPAPSEPAPAPVENPTETPAPSEPAPAPAPTKVVVKRVVRSK